MAGYSDSSPNIAAIAAVTAGVIYDKNQQQKAMAKLLALEERKSLLERATGATLLGYLEFEKSSPTPSVKSPWAPIILSALAAAGALAFSATLPVVLGLAAAGMVVGYLVPEGKVRHLQYSVARYEGYLNAAESSVTARGRSPVYGLAGHRLHAETVLAERAQEKSSAISI